MTEPVTPAPRKRAPRKAAAAPPVDQPTVAQEAETPVAVRRRSLLALPDGWNYSVQIVNGDDSISIAPQADGSYAVAVALNGRASSASAPDLSSGLDAARQILKGYVAYKEQMLAFESSLGLFGQPADTVAAPDAEVVRVHADANGAVVDADIQDVVAAESAGSPTLAEKQVAP